MRKRTEISVRSYTARCTAERSTVAMSVIKLPDAAGSGYKRTRAGATGATERRVQPRHVQGHADPNAVVAATGAVADQPPPATRLYRHALECIFAFLDHRELLAVLYVSRDWRSAVNSMGRLDLSFSVKSSSVASIRAIPQSAMGRHITHLLCASRSMSLPDLVFVLSNMPQLHELRCHLLSVDQAPPPPLPLAPFSSELRELGLVCDGVESAVVDWTPTMAVIGRISALESIHFNFGVLDSRTSFAALAGLPLLRDLSMYKKNWLSALSDTQIDELRALLQLQKLTGQSWSNSQLSRLVQGSHRSQLQNIGRITPDGLNEPTALLPQLPSLTTLECHGSTDFAFLTRLPHLTHIELTCVTVRARMDELVDGLRSCTKLKSLSISHCRALTAGHLAQILLPLKSLKSLTFQNLDIESLSFLSVDPGGVAKQLTTLRLICCKKLPLADLDHVVALRSLEMLAIQGSFTEPMDADRQTSFRSPSRLMPTLTSFHYLRH